MKFLPLIWAGLWRKPVRTVLTVLSLITAFLLFGLLRSVDAGFDNLIAHSQADRLFVAPRFFGLPLPVAYAGQIARINGVKEVGFQTLIGGYHKDPKIPFFVGGASANFFDIFSEVEVSKANLDALHAKRNGALITPAMARRLGGVKVGDHVGLHTPGTLQKNGSADWDLEIVGFIERTDAPGVFAFSVGNFDYVNEARAADQNTVQQIGVRVADPAKALQIARNIDALFINSGVATRTSVDSINFASAVASLGNVKLMINGILACVLVVLLLLTATTLAQSVDERRVEFATMKTLGFTDRGVMNCVFAEALVQCLVGAGIGLAAATFISPLAQGRVPGPPIFFHMPGVVIAMGLIVAVVMAGFAAAIPAWRLSRLQIVEALMRS